MFIRAGAFIRIDPIDYTILELAPCPVRTANLNRNEKNLLGKKKEKKKHSLIRLNGTVL